MNRGPARPGVPTVAARLLLVLLVVLASSGCARDAAPAGGSTTTGTQPPAAIGTTIAGSSVPRPTVPVTTPEAAAEKAIARHAAGAATTTQQACVVDAFRARPDLVAAVTDSPGPSLDQITEVVQLLIACDPAMVMSGFLASAPPEVTVEQKTCLQAALSRMSPTDLAQIAVMQSAAANFSSLMNECHVVLTSQPAGSPGSTEVGG